MPGWEPLLTLRLGLNPDFPDGLACILLGTPDLAAVSVTYAGEHVSGADSRADRRTGCRGADRQQCFQVDASDIHPRSLALAREFAPVTALCVTARPPTIQRRAGSCASRSASFTSS